MNNKPPLTPMIPFTAWRFGDRPNWTFRLLDVWESSDGIVTWIRVSSHADADGVTALVAMAYAGLARVARCLPEEGASGDDRVYSIELDYGAN